MKARGRVARAVALAALAPGAATASDLEAGAPHKVGPNLNAVVRGNGMAFAGIANDADRASLIAWLLANGAGG